MGVRLKQNIKKKLTMLTINNKNQEIWNKECKKGLREQYQTVVIETEYRKMPSKVLKSYQRAVKKQSKSSWNYV